jgi:hypothetical protein
MYTYSLRTHYTRTVHCWESRASSGILIINAAL